MWLFSWAYKDTVLTNAVYLPRTCYAYHALNFNLVLNTCLKKSKKNMAHRNTFVNRLTFYERPVNSCIYYIYGVKGLLYG